jgi:hypothetical protein
MSDFAERVEHYLKGIEHVSTGPCPGCDECGLGDVEDMASPDYESAGEPSFSWSDCDCCGSSLGGDRHPAHGTYHGDLIHLDVCTDCVMYLEYGDEPTPQER